MSGRHATGGVVRRDGLAVLLRIAWRTNRRAALVWVVGLAATMVFTAVAVAGLYDTPAKIQSYADAVTAGNALRAINGHVEGVDTLGGVIQDEFGFMAAFLLPLLGISLVARMTRREEEQGRLELVLGGRLGRHQPTVAALVVVAATITATTVLFTAGLAITGVGTGGAVLYALSLGCLALVFAGVAALLAQVTLHARGVYGGGLILLALAYVLRGVGDVTAAGWLTWLSPLGWQEKAAPFGPPRWWTLAIPLVVALVLSLAAVRLAASRDLGSALVRQGSGPDHARASLRSAWGLAAHIHRPTFFGWLAGAVLLTGLLGALAQQMIDALIGNPAMADAMGLSASTGPIDGLTAVTHLYLAVIATGWTVQAVGTLRAEEAEGRLETRLAGTLSRTRWLLAHAGVVLAGLVVIVLGASLVLALTTGWSVAAGVDAGPMIWSGLAYLPAELVLAGLALAVYGLRPRAFPVAWAAYAVTVFIAFLGPGLKLGQWLLDLAPTTHVGNPPVGSTSAIDLGVLTALAFVLALVGVVAFRRRGIPQG
jgi:ABC-2 type transport system permease protein